ncbi:MAG: VWA domain-containing protein [Acidobacteria bacterium]|nr:VWA domain-containing protein [Candidatus Sulfomarinibacter kjeldsenii]
MVSFAEPARLAFLALPLLTGVLALYRHRRRLLQQRRLASPGVWRRLLGGTPATGVVRLIVWSGAAAFLVVAVARPQWGEMPAEETIRTRDLVIALDVSDSMLCEDLRPSRLTRSVETLIRLLPQLEGNRMAVVVFAGEAYSLVPLTTDLSAIAVFLEGVGPGMVALPGSNLEGAVGGSLKLLPPEGEGRVVLLFTDGENLQGDVNAAIEALSEASVGLLGIVAGTEQGGPIPEHDERGGVRYKRDQNGQPVVTRAHPEVLTEIADRVDGEVVSLGDPEVVREIADAVARLRTREVEETRNIRRVERFPIFLVAAAIFLFLGFAMSPWRRLATAAAIVVLAAPSFALAQAVSPATSAPHVDAPPVTENQEVAEETLPSASWWQRLIPGGSRRLARRGVGKWRQQKFDEATMSFAGAAELDPDGPERLYDLGTALAAGGRLETATPLLATADQSGVPFAAYNSGTAALVQSQPDAALEWLRRAMLADPDDLAAKHNYELALRMRDQQQQEQQNDQQQDQQQEQEQEQEEGDGEQKPTPTPSQGQGPAPTPTPDPNQPLFAALERAEAEAREALRSPTPKAGKVEKDW